MNLPRLVNDEGGPTPALLAIMVVIVISFITLSCAYPVTSKYGQWYDARCRTVYAGGLSGQECVLK